MQLFDILVEEDCLAKIDVKDKPSLLRTLVEKVCDNYKLNFDEVYKAILDRESLMSTGLGDSIGIPHAKLDSLKTVHVICATTKNPIDFDSLDGKKANLFFLVIGPKNQSRGHLEVLSQIATLVKDKALIRLLMMSDDSKELYDNIIGE